MPPVLGMTQTAFRHPNAMSRKEVSVLLRQRLSDPQEIQKAREEAAVLRHKNVSESHQQRRTRLVEDLKTTRDLPTLIRVWEKTTVPNVTVSYAATLLKLRPDLRTAEVKDALDRVRQKGGPLTTKRARPVTPNEVLRAMDQAKDIRVRRTLFLIFVSASRHMDLFRVLKWADSIARGVLMLQWASWKSDRYGTRAFSKFVHIPQRFRYLFKEWTLASYYEVYSALKKVCSDLSVHSLRRGACSLLACAGFTMEEIQLLTGHTPTADKCLAVRGYVDPHESQPECQLQLRMSRTVGNALDQVNQ